MEDARIKFIWGTDAKSSARWKLGLFALHRHALTGIPNLSYLSHRAQKIYQKKTLFVSVRGLLSWGCALALIAYFAGAQVLFKIQSRHPHNQITYSDLVLPWRWPELTALRGRAFVAQAKDEFTEGKFMSGFNLLRLGLVRDPGNTQARLELSQLYILLRLRSQSDKLLLQAFDYGYPGREFLIEAYSRLGDADNTDRVNQFLQKARASLSTTGGVVPDERLLDGYTIEAWLKSGRAQEAAGLASRIYPQDSDERTHIMILAALEAGDPSRASELASAWVNRRPKAEEVMALAAVTYRQAGRYDDMQALLDQMRALAPHIPNHATFTVVQNLLAGRDAQAKAALEDWFFRFGANSNALAELTRDISKARRDDFLARIEEVVLDHGFDPEAVRLGRLLVQIKTRNWTGATATTAQLQAMRAHLPASDKAVVDLLSALVVACVDAGGGNQHILIDTFSRNPGSLEFDRTMIDALVASNRIATAADLITLVEGSYPDSEYVTKVAGELSERMQAFAQAEEAARPALPASPAESFSDGAAFLANITRLEETGESTEALRQIRAMRKAAPTWLGGIDEPLSGHELSLAFQADDMPLLQLTLRNYLRGQPTRAQTALDLATRWHAEGRKNEPLLVAREILRLWPDFQPALQALAIWDPKPPTRGLQPVSSASDS